MAQEEKREYQRLWTLAFPEKRKSIKSRCDKKHGYYYLYSNEYRKLRPEVYSESAKRYRRKYPDRVRNQNRVKMQRRRTSNPNYRILESLRSRLNTALKGLNKSARTVDLLGCSIKDFRIYIESLFETGMSWANYGKGGWELDHIIPCALFDLSRTEHQKRCFHFSNIQPLWREDNLRKLHYVVSNKL